ncbi:MAG: shikimate kinase [Crenarchaeota archaeon]|nr:shikimate kinase [Thermoproteota archaeon]
MSFKEKTESVNIVTFSAVTIVNALPCGKGSAFAIDIPTHITVQVSDEDYVDSADSKTILRFVDRYREMLDIEDRFRINIRTQIPPGSGLKSSSSVTTGVALGISALSRPDMTLRECITLSCKICRELGISFTGALDDATASTLGGLIYTDNDLNRIIEIADIDDDILVLILLLKTWKRPDNMRELFKKMRNDLLLRRTYEKIFDLALKDPLEAAFLNTAYIGFLLNYDLSLIYHIKRRYRPMQVIISGNGPAIAVVDTRLEKLNYILSEMSKEVRYYRICKVVPQIRDPDEKVSKVFSPGQRLMMHLSADTRYS